MRLGPSTWLALALASWATIVSSAVGGAPVAATDASGTTQEKTQSVPSPKPTGRGSEGQTYVGQAKCVECHDDMRKGYAGSPHHWAPDPRCPVATQGCESCHGPGSKHAEEPGTFRMHSFIKMAAEEGSALCATC